jgi:hypothetical protein
VGGARRNTRPTLYHAAGGGCRKRPVKSVVEALRRLDWTWAQVEDWTVCTPSVCICLWWRVSRWARRCPLTKPAVTAVELLANIEPHCSRCVQPGGGIYVHMVQREPTPGGPGSPGLLFFFFFSFYDELRGAAARGAPM